jgi:FAD-dependent urate hydroxylase
MEIVIVGAGIGGLAAALAMLRSRYGRWPRPVPQLLDSLTSAEIECWPYVRHRVPARYARPGVVLIGDAVHAMPPSLAQGVSQTLEDAWVLARELGRRPGPADALLAYQRARRRKVLAVSRQASSSLSQRADGWFLRHAALPPPVLTSVFGTYLRAVSNIL